ncbi:MAG: aldehyde-activating protein [Candidatus Binataceae bacterium]
MKSAPLKFSGSCHCGNIAVSFVTSIPLAKLKLRSDSCSFCTKHRARNATDPHGHLTITVHTRRDLRRYRFDLRTADFLLCKQCGVYVAAIMNFEGSSYATLNTNTLDARDRLKQESVPVDYIGETAAARRTRRAANWTLATLRIIG